MPRHRAFAIVLTAAVLAACGRPAPQTAVAAPKAPASAPTLLLGPEDVRTLAPARLAQGPVVSGSLVPQRRADLRAEVAAVVTQVLKDNGDPVRRGELLVRLDDTALRDSLASADAAARAARQTLEQSERQLARLKSLQAQGMVSLQALEDAEVRRNQAHSDVAAAAARVVAARQQLQRTEVRAPFDGVVSERKVSAGDTAQVGRELLKVIDPASLVFEGLVATERLQELRPGQSAVFRVNGHAGVEFTGRVQRVDAAADAATRQVEVTIAFSGGARPKVAGLYAEGRIDTGARETLLLPESAVVRSGDTAHVWQVRDGVLRRSAVTLGARDPRRGEFAVLSGLQAGDRVLRHPGSALVDGQKVEFAAPATTAAASAATLVK